MVWWFLACVTGSGLSEPGLAARDDLAAALAQADPEQVAHAAQAVGEFEGQDAALDRLLGDALANVLLRPDEGLALLRRRADPASVEWRRAVGDAALRSRDKDVMAAVGAEAGLDPVALDHPVVDQVADRARHERAVGWSTLVDVVGRCQLLDRSAERGLSELDLPAPANLPASGLAVGLDRVVMGRPPGAPGTKDLWHCRKHDLLSGDVLPDPLPRNLVVVGARDAAVLTILVKQEDAGPWAYASNDPEAAARWIAAANRLAEQAGDGE